MKHFLLEREKDHLTFMARSLAEQQGRSVADKAQLLELIANSKEVYSYFESYHEARLREYLTKFKNEFSVLSYVNKDGVEELKSVKGKLSYQYKDIGASKIFRRALDSPRKANVSAPFYSDEIQTPSVQLAYVQKTYFGETFIGLMLATINLSDITQKIISNKVRETGSICVVDSQGTILAHENSEIILTEIIGEGREAGSLIADIKELKPGITRATVFGIDGIYAYQPIRDLSWNIIVALPQAEFLKAPNILRNNILIVLLVVTLVGWIISIKLSSSLIKPLSKLTDATKTASKGDFNHPIDLNTGDETGILAKAFNTMLQDLQKTTFRKEYVENIINSLGDTLIVLTKEGIIKSTNKAACDLLGYREEELIGMPCSFVLGDDEFKAILEKTEIKDLIRRGDLRKTECEYTTESGERIPVLFSGSLIYDSQGYIDGIVCIAIDLRKQKDAEKEKKGLQSQLQQAQKMEAIGTLTGGIAHDFNNIVSTMLGFIYLLSIKPRDKEDSEYLDVLQKSGERAADLVAQMLTFSRVDDDQLKAVRIAPLIQETMKMMRAVLPATIAIEQNIEKADWYIMANTTQIHQVLVNLCSNADHAMKEKGGILQINLVKVNRDFNNLPPDIGFCRYGYLQLTVRDTGCGMSTDVKKRLFDPFFTTKEVGEGTGLGLSMVHGIMKSHKGAITVDSQPGMGTTFALYFPILEKTKSVISSPSRPPAVKGFQSIMIVEDEVDLAKFYQLAFKKMGFKTAVFNHPREALNSFSSNPGDFDLVYTDFTMPSMTGLELSRELLRINPTLPIVLVSGYQTEELKKNVETCGIAHFLPKPVNLDYLSQVLKNIFQ